jgi:hypothetical protein
MDEDKIVDRIKGIAPLRAGNCGAFKQGDVLNRQPQQVGHVDQKLFLVIAELPRDAGTDGEQSERAIFARDKHDDSARELFGAEAFREA